MIWRLLVLPLLLFLLAGPVVAQAQKAGRVYHIGVLEVVPITQNAANFAALRRGLKELGYVEGQNVVIEYRSADGRTERLADLARELVQLKLDVIVTRGTPAALAAQHATRAIPIVMASSGEPALEGVVASLARPGGNVTGLHITAPPELGGKLRSPSELERAFEEALLSAFHPGASGRGDRVRSCTA